jgi:hypothetical protein
MTNTDLANMALSRLGEPRISDIAENSPAAIACRENLEMVRDSLLRQHAWNFATGRAVLTAGTTPAFRWAYAYPVPSDFLRLSTLNGSQASKIADEYTFEGGSILTDAQEAKITYVKRITDPGLFDPIFVEVMVYRLASSIAMSLTADMGKRDTMEMLAEARLHTATFVDAGERKHTTADPLEGFAARTRGLADWSINPPFPPFEA